MEVYAAQCASAFRGTVVPHTGTATRIRCDEVLKGSPPGENIAHWFTYGPKLAVDTPVLVFISPTSESDHPN